MGGLYAGSTAQAIETTSTVIQTTDETNLNDMDWLNDRIAIMPQEFVLTMIMMIG